MRSYIHILLTMVVCFVLAQALPTLAQNIEEKQVVAKGVGINEEEAKRQAYRNAVQSVVGAMVQAETLVQNDALVHDKVLSHSDGYITKVEQVGETRTLPGNLLEITMRVTVKSGKLKEKLQAENITLANVDGESLFVQAATMQEKANSAATIIVAQLQNVPANLITASADVAKAEIQANQGVHNVKIPVVARVDMAAYTTFINGLKQKLAEAGFAQRTLTVPLDIYEPKPGSHLRVRGDALNYDAVKWPYHAIFICEMINVAAKQSRWTTVYVTPEVTALFATLPAHVLVNLSLQDAQQQPVTALTLPVLVSSSYFRRNRNIFDYQSRTNGSLVLVVPMLASSMHPIYSADGSLLFGAVSYETWSGEATFMLSEQELRNGKSLRATVVNGPPRKPEE